jgi:hypothetical protein
MAIIPRRSKLPGLRLQAPGVGAVIASCSVRDSIYEPPPLTDTNCVSVSEPSALDTVSVTA